MQQNKNFGRRAPPTPLPPRVAPKLRVEPAVEHPEIEPVQQALYEESVVAENPTRALPSVEQELEEWKASRKVRRRSFREPWRSVSIVAGVCFAATSWLVPDSVANVTQLALGVLTAGSIYAGWRARKTPTATSSDSFSQ